MAKRQTSIQYIWWFIGACAGIGLCVVGYCFWPTAPDYTKKRKTVSEPVSHAAVPGAAYTAADTAIALFSHSATPGKVQQMRLVSDNTLPLATILAKSGEAALRGKALSDGLFLYLNKVNTQYGGLGGKIRIALDQRDDSGRILPAAHQMSQLLDTHSVFFSPMGDTVLEKIYMPLLRAGKAAFFFPVAGLRPTLTTPLPLMFFRPSYTQEVAALVHYAVQVLKKTKIAVFYEETEWGRHGKRAVERLLAQQQLTLSTAASYQPGSVNVQTALTQVQKAEPHVVICIANGRPAYNFIREAVNRRLHYVSFLGISLLAGISEHLQNSRGITLVTSSVVPNPHNSDLPIVKEYRTDMQQYLPNKGLSTSSLEGYINSMLLTNFLQQLPSTATVYDLWQKMATMKRQTLKGLALENKNNTLSHTIWINEGRRQQWHEYVVRDA